MEKEEVWMLAVGGFVRTAGWWEEPQCMKTCLRYEAADTVTLHFVVLLLENQNQLNDLLNHQLLKFHLSLSLFEFLILQNHWQNVLKTWNMAEIFTCCFLRTRLNYHVFSNHMLLLIRYDIDKIHYFNSFLGQMKNISLNLALKMEFGRHTHSACREFMSDLNTA